MRFTMMLAGALLVSACGPKDSSTDNGGDDAPEIELPRAGLYRVTEISEIFGPTPGVAGRPEVFESCLSDQSEEDLLVASGMNCTPEQIQVEDGKVSAILRCSAPGTTVQGARLDYRGSYSANGAELTGDVVMPDGMIRLTRKLERLGDC